MMWMREEVVDEIGVVLGEGGNVDDRGGGE